MTDGGGQLTRNADNSRQIRRRINLALKLRAVECLVWVAPKTICGTKSGSPPGQEERGAKIFEQKYAVRHR
jgi:hypothetical protein